MKTNFRKYSDFIVERYSGDHISIFDVDDTLVVTKAKIKVYDPHEDKEYSLTPAEFNEYERKAHHKIDFSEFDDAEILMNGRPIEWVLKILVNTMNKQKAVGIITARGDKQLIINFLNKHGINVNPAFVFAVNPEGESKYKGSNAERKQQAFEELIKLGFKNFRFFDDNLDNLEYAKKLEEKYPEVKVETKHIQSRWIPKFE